MVAEIPTKNKKEDRERDPGVAFGQELGSVAFVGGEGGHRSGEALCLCRVCLQRVEY